MLIGAVANEAAKRVEVLLSSRLLRTQPRQSRPEGLGNRRK
jgi:hypothetical protein